MPSRGVQIKNAITHFLVYSTWDWSSPMEMDARSDRLTNDVIPILEELTPGSGTYRMRPITARKAFFRDHWDRLGSIQQT